MVTKEVLRFFQLDGIQCLDIKCIMCLRRNPSARGPGRPRALHALPPRSTHPPAFHHRFLFLFSFLARARRDEPRDLLFAFVLQIDRLLLSREIDASQMRISPARLVDGEDISFNDDAFENDIIIISFRGGGCGFDGGGVFVVFSSVEQPVEKSQDPSRGPRPRTVKDGHLGELKRPTNGHFFFSLLWTVFCAFCVCVEKRAPSFRCCSPLSLSCVCARAFLLPRTTQKTMQYGISARSIFFSLSPIKIYGLQSLKRL